MTSKSVTQAEFYLQNVTNKKQTPKQSGDSKNSFGTIMNGTIRQGETNVVKDKRTQKAAEGKKSEAKSTVKSTASKAQTDTTKNTPREKDKVDILEKVEKVVEDITEKIADEFGMTEEELVQAMEALGMQMTDLLQPNMLANLIAELSGEGDMLAVVTNEELYTMLSDITQMISKASEELLQAYDLSPEELKQILETMQTEESNLEVEENSPKDLETSETMPKEMISKEVIVKETISKATQVAETPKETKVDTPEDNIKVEEAVQTEEDPQESDNRMQGNGQKQSGENVETSKEQMQVIEPKEETESGKTEASKETTLNPLQSFSEQMTAKLDAVLQKAAVPMEAADTQRIMRQVTEYLKLNIRAEVTEMQIKLNPASLGAIDLSVAYKDGALTAQFTAQNEAVKAALETQIVQLRENLNEQGLKVEAIEVTIASHEFERNLSQGNTGGEAEAKNAKSGKRKINLDSMEFLEDLELDEAERIAVELMKESGNTVDFTA